MPDHRAHVDKLEFALADVERNGRADRVSVIVKLKGDESLPTDAKIVTRFGDIVTVTLPSDTVRDFAESDAVDAIEAVRGLHQSSAPALASDSLPNAYTRRPPQVTATGKGCVVAVLDWGVDFAFESLMTHEPGDQRGRKTRFLGIWDQRDSPGSGDNRWGYGRVLSREQIDDALASDDPYSALDYHPAEADSRHPRTGRWQGAHGTHVLDIAAGNGNGGGMSGVAPEADLLFCHLSRTTKVIGPGSFGDSATVLHALDWLFETAGDRPVVVNMSVGAHGGPHDGSTLVEQGIDRAIELAPGRVVVNSAGNYFVKSAHASGKVSAGGASNLRFFVPGEDPTPSELELWHAPVDAFVVTLDGPGDIAPARISAGDRVELQHQGQTYAHASYGPRNNGDYSLSVVFLPAAPEGVWTLNLAGDRVNDGRYHAWIERDSGLQPRFIGHSIDPGYTTGTICNGRNSITVGAYDPARPDLALGRFSSAGPTRDGRVKPELIAPGVGIDAARSTPPHESPGPRFIAKSGTSMAAPHVAGCISLMQECLGERVSIAETRALLFSTLRRAPSPQSHRSDLHRVGYGMLDIEAAERAARDWRARSVAATDKKEDTGMELDTDHQATATLAPEALDYDEGMVADDAEYDEAVTFDDRLDDDAGRWPWESWSPATQGESAAHIAAVPDSSYNSENIPATMAQMLLQQASPGAADLATLLGAALGELDDSAVEVVASSRGFVENSVHSGDLLTTRRGDRFTVIAGEAPESADALWQRGVPVAWSGPGSYVEVIEQNHAEGAPRTVGRRLSDPYGRLVRGSQVLRYRAPAEDEWPMEPRLVERQDPWCARRAEIARVASLEEADWTAPNGNRRLESERGRLPALTRYWSAVPGFAAPASALRAARMSAAGHRDFHWSAAFICYVMATAGITRADGFEFGGAHMRYIVGALRNRELSDQARPFWLVDAVELVNEVRLAPGDLLCFNRVVRRNGQRRRTTHSYDSLRRQFWLNNRNRPGRGSSHTSLIVGTEQRNGRNYVQTIGGNEANSVRLQRVPINDSGGIDNPAASHIFGAIKITRC